MTFTPTAREALDRVYAEYRAALHTSFPAKVAAYDVAKQTVDLSPAIAREVAADDPDVAWGFEALPTLVNVPVMWPRAGGHVITFPLKVGDWMLVVCAEQSTMLWRQKGTLATHPAINDPHGLNGCVALPGWFPDTQKLANVSGSDLVIGNLESDATVRIKPDGEVVVGGADGSDYVALAKKVDAEIAAIATTLASRGPHSPSPQGR
jgi:hypothetical protein